MTNVVPTSPLPPVAWTTIGNDLICYKLRCPNRPPDQEIEDRFGVRTQTRYRSSLLCVPARATDATTTTTTSTSPPSTCAPTTTMPVRPNCVGTAQLDPDDEITTLVRGQPTTVRVRPASTSGGNFNVSVYEPETATAAECQTSGCHFQSLMQCGDTDVLFTFTPPPDAPASLTLTANLAPQSVPFDCGFGSSGDSDSRTYPVVDP